MARWTRNAAALAAIGAGLAGCMDGGPGATRPAPPAAKVVGAAVDCVPLPQLRESRVRDDSTIDFVGTGKRAWRNTLPASCPGLGSERRFSYETSLSQLCSTDIIYVLQYYGDKLQRGAGCGLGKFVPVELAK